MCLVRIGLCICFCRNGEKEKKVKMGTQGRLGWVGEGMEGEGDCGDDGNGQGQIRLTPEKHITRYHHRTLSAAQ